MEIIRVSYGVTVCNEFEESMKLLNQLIAYKGREAEIVVLLDKPKAPQELIEFLQVLGSSDQITLVEAEFKGDFAQWKNTLNSYCKGEWIYQLDADENLNPEMLVNMIDILNSNENTDLIFIPRINTVSGLTESHIKKWGWNISKLPNQISEKEFDLDNPDDLDEYNLLKKYNLIIEENKIKVIMAKVRVKFNTPIIQFPDYQTRLFKNKPEIVWSGKVHERILGFETYTNFPVDELYCIRHDKSIQKQEKQNRYYESL